MQNYHISLESSIYWRDDEKLKFKSFKELKDYIKNDIEYLLRYYPVTTEQKEKYQIKKIYKRIEKLGIYQDTKDKGTLIDWKNPDPKTYKNQGYSFQVNYLDKKGNYEYLLEYLCYRVPKSELWKYANFKEINQN